MECYHYFMLNRLLKKHSNKSFNSKAGFDEFNESSLSVYEEKKGGPAYLNMPVYLLIQHHAKKLGLKVEVGTYEWWHDPEDNPISAPGSTPGIMINKTDRIKTKGTACMEGMFYPLYTTEFPAMARRV